MVKSAKIQEGIVELLTSGEAHSVQDIKNYLTEIGIVEYSEGQFSGSLTTLQRNGTIKKNDRGVYSLRQDGDDVAKKCFVISPISKEGGEIRKNADILFKHIIEPVCAACGFLAERVDLINDADSITQKILDNLESADLVIADITGHNPNVFYEMGYRRRTGKPIIHIRRKGEELPFDISAIRTFDYDFDVESVSLFNEKLINTINSFSFPSNDESSENQENLEQEKNISPIVPLLYNILEAIEKLSKEVKNNDERTLQTVIKAVSELKPQSPEMSQEDRLIEKLLPIFIQNPESMMQLVEFSGKFQPNQLGKRNKH